MSTHTSKSHLLFERDGTCQVERLPKNLLNNNALIDERTLDEYVLFVYLYSDLIQYYGSQNTAVKHNAWRKFLENDDTVIYSLIIHTEIARLRPLINNDFLLLEKEKVISDENKHIQRLLRLLEELLLLIDYWYENLSTDSKVQGELHILVRRELNDRLTFLYNVLHQWNSQTPSATLLDFCDFVEDLTERGAPWELKATTAYESAVGSTVVQSTMSTLKELLDILLSSLQNIQALARAGYADTLQSQQHQPQTALLIAFLRLLQHATERLNKIPQRHLDFYYKEVLKFRPLPVQADQVVVQFQVQPWVIRYFLPPGVKILAGKDKEGHDIIFKTHSAIMLNHGVVSKVHRVQQVVEEPTQEGFLPVGSISAATYNEEIIDQPAPSATPQQDNTHQQEVNRHFLGLVVASPIFYLKEGNREVKLKFKFSKPSFETLLERIRKSKEEDLGGIQDKMIVLFKEAIDIYLTSEASWMYLPPTNITIVISLEEEDCIEFLLSLPPDMPPVVNFDPTVHEGTYDIQAPAIRLGLNDPTHFGHIYLFKDLVLNKLALEVVVTDYKDLTLQNDSGLIDTSLPFQPFGPFPQLHANFYLGSDELFYKDLKSLSINIEWDNLPTVEGGWTSHYQGYPQQVNNEDFEVSVSYLNHRQWYPLYAENRQRVPLFTTEEEGGRYGTQKLQRKRSINEIDLDRLNLAVTEHKLTASTLTPKTLAGFLRLELVGPKMAFGHSLYPTLMGQSFIQRASSKNSKNKAPASPPPLNEPYTPVIKSLSVDYSAREEIFFTSRTEEEEQPPQTLIRLAPFGHKKVFPNKTGPVTFLSGAESVGCFFCFGFEQLTASFLSVHLQIDEKSIDPDKAFPRPVWQYLSHNDWINFEDDEIISDGTDGLTKAGIIVLSIPPAANQDNTLFSPGLIWVRAVFFEAMEALPTLVSIRTQVVMASRVIDKDRTAELPNTLRPGSLQNVWGDPKEIKAVLQPFASFGGKPAENSDQFYTRISERLRHKNRAISAWDYERLVLEKFPEIFRVKCINHSSKAKPWAPYPGRVMMVVINRLQSSNEESEFTPRVTKQLLREIERYLQSVSSPFVEFEVMNPMYEEVKVNIEVKFRPTYEKGIYLNKLQKEIRNFLSPWLFDEAEDVKLGGIMPSSKIIDFINKKEYVEGIGNFSILKYTGQGARMTITKITDYDNYLKATYPWSVMVSANKHKISVLDKIRARLGLRRGGVDEMRVGEDFIVGPWQEGKSKDWAAEAKQEVLQESLEEYYLVTKKNIKKRTPHGDS